MIFPQFLKKVKKVHFVGIGGISMSALAKYSLSLGLTVSGSDVSKNEHTESLKKAGVKIYKKHRAGNVRNVDLLVYSSATDINNPEIKRAEKLGATVMKRSEFLGGIVGEYPCSIGVCGSHGKTTTTAMIAHALKEAGLNPVAFIGGDDKLFGNFLAGGDDYLVFEACEFKKNFLDIKPKISVVLNIDDDHPDTYNGMIDAVETFAEFIKGTVSVVNADDSYASALKEGLSVRTGIKSVADYTAKRLTKKDGKYSFTFCKYGIKTGRINLATEGKHNVYNALSACVVCDMLGISFESVKKALEEFVSVGRRNEFLGIVGKTECYADYAHHPNEIDAFALSKGNGKFLTVFQPHTYSRTEKLMSGFVKSLKEKTPLVIYATYPAREKYSFSGSAEKLYAEICLALGKDGETTLGKVYYAESREKLFKILDKRSDADAILFIGAGDIYDVGKRYVSERTRILTDHPSTDG